MVAYYQHEIASWMDGTENLSDGAYRVYHVICQLIYLHDGPISHNAKGLAARCNQRAELVTRYYLPELEKAGKITIEGGKINNVRCGLELARIKERRGARKGSPAGAKVAPPSARSTPATTPVPARYPPATLPPPVRYPPATDPLPSKPLKNNNPTLFENCIEKRREEKSEERREEEEKMPSEALGASQAELERDLFRRGKQVLGKNAGGMISTLLKAKQYDVAIARSIIEMAATKYDPREYISAVLKNVNGNGAPNGKRTVHQAARDLADKIRAINEGPEIFEGAARLGESDAPVRGLPAG